MYVFSYQLKQIYSFNPNITKVKDIRQGKTKIWGEEREFFLLQKHVEFKYLIHKQ